MAWRKSIVPSDTTVLPGMQILPADKSQTGIVNYFPDIPYVQREEESLLLQLLLPCGLAPGTPSDRIFPLVVFVQGAAWGEQEKYRNIPQLVQVAREGFVVASVKHRAATVAKFPAFLQDIKAAIRFLRAHAKEYYIDPEQVASGEILRGDMRLKWWVLLVIWNYSRQRNIGSIPMLFK